MKYPFKTAVDSNSVLTIGQSMLSGTSIVDVRGSHNLVEIGDNVKGRMSLTILGDNNKVIIEDGIHIVGRLHIAIRCGDSIIVVGRGSTFQGLVKLFNHESSSIIIGADCMFSSDITVTTSDMHAIFDADNVRINKAASIMFGDHVWVGQTAKILKGVTIGSGSVVGMSSLVTRGVYPENCIIAGNPARVVREGIRWTRQVN